MLAFYRDYQAPETIVQLAVAQLPAGPEGGAAGCGTIRSCIKSATTSGAQGASLAVRLFLVIHRIPPSGKCWADKFPLYGRLQTEIVLLASIHERQLNKFRPI